MRPEGIGVYAATIFGAGMGFVVGLRRLEPTMDQDLYWLWLALWVGSGAAIGAAGGFILQLLRRRD